MAKTKLDRVLEILEQQVSQTPQASEGMANTSEPTAPEATTIQATVSDTEAPVVATAPVDTQTEGAWDVTDLNVDQLPEKSDNATEDPSQQESDSFDKDFAELAALVGYDATAKPEAKPEEAELKPDPVDEPLTEEENQNYKKMFDQEVERRVAAEGEARNAVAEAKYRKTMLEKEGDKYYWTIDKQKELEAELRVAKAAQMPEQIAPLWQSYLLWEETKTPTHKRRAIKDALTLVENMTWVSAEDYYWTILRAENKDVPEVTDKSPVTSTVQNLNWQKQTPFMSL